jgi:hypothetical protein
MVRRLIRYIPYPQRAIHVDILFLIGRFGTADAAAADDEGRRCHLWKRPGDSYTTSRTQVAFLR